MNFLNVIPFLLLNVACSVATTIELSREGLAAPHHRRSQKMVEELATFAVQTYYIPFPEDLMFNQFFVPINRNATKGNAVSIIAMSISTDNTIIWYDHWEDGYDTDLTNVTTLHPKTEVWGDGNATNGCQPTIECTNAADKLMAGMSFVIQNERIAPFRDPLVYRYDGGDKVATNFPIAISRGGYPTRPGTELAGAMEVLDTSRWGMNFIAPVGNGSSTFKSSFEFSAFLVMAKEANTTVELWSPRTLNVLERYVLQEGESRLINTRLSQPLKSDKPVQVSMITGDIDSLYESRWYSVIDLPQWSTQYITPTGETFGRTKLWLYNPNTVPMTVQMETRNAATGAKVFQTLSMTAKNYTLSPYVYDGTGAIVTASGTSAALPFMTFSFTDAEQKDSNGATTLGQMYDWGFPVQPLADLTSHVLIAWGYGCTNNACGTEIPRSVVWITPVANATLYIDYQNSGNTTKMNVKRLQSVKITDPIDKDMSGAMIFAVIENGTPDSKPVNIAASWGQDPSVSLPLQALSLDLGTTVLPFFSFIVNKVVDKEFVSPAEYLIYTIRVYNLGQSRINARMILLKDTLDSWVTYVPNTTTAALVNTTYIQAIPDDVNGTAFPLDGDGAMIPLKLDPRGGMVDVTFEVKLKPASVILMKAENIITNGTMSGNSLPTLPFDAISHVIYKPNITLTNKVYLGNDVAGVSCSSAVEYVEGIKDTGVVYCFRITNNGHTYLKNVTLQDRALTYKKKIGVLAPGASIVVPLVKSILSNLTNNAFVTGNPIFKNGTDIPGEMDVNATDLSVVGILPYLPNVTVTNTVYLGSDSAGASCSGAVEYVEGDMSTGVVYCFNITNTGNTRLGNITLSNGALAYSNNIIDSLAPGESILVPFVSSILTNLTNNVIVVGNPVVSNGTDIAGLPDVTATDPSSVGLLVYLGSGDSAGTYWKGYASTGFIYCFIVATLLY